MKKLNKSKFFSLILYLIPILFFFTSYFLLTTSGEDIVQGAGNFSNSQELNFLSDATSAFNHSGRITDIYAWTVIDLYDYQFQFGIDIFLRLIDLTIICGALYLSLYLILNRRPKLILKDALIFITLFTAVIFTPFGRRLYSEFSMIHNYSPLVFTTLLFAVPYLKLLLNRQLHYPRLISATIIPLGIIFGMTTTITPLAFLVTVVLYCIINRKHLVRPPFWFFAGLIGLIIGSIISNLLSPGMSGYASNPASVDAFDYISISALFENFGPNCLRLLYHLAYNFGILLLPLIMLFIICFICTPHARTLLTKAHFKALPSTTKLFILTFVLFIIIHTIATVQIKVLPRILIPAYFTGVIIILYYFAPHLHFKRLGSFAIPLSIIAVLIHLVFVSEYHFRSANILQEIKASDAEIICIDETRNQSIRIPLINLSQDNLIVNWYDVPQYIYGKQVILCE